MDSLLGLLLFITFRCQKGSLKGCLLSNVSIELRSGKRGGFALLALLVVGVLPCRPSSDGRIRVPCSLMKSQQSDTISMNRCF